MKFEKVIVAGSRDFSSDENYLFLSNILDAFSEGLGAPQEIISGGARGTDSLGEKYARERNIKLVVFPADWNKYGKRAGVLRNIEMGNYADSLIAFWDGKSPGTKHMIEYAKTLNLYVNVIIYNNNNNGPTII